jgi:hypothetical protein
MLNVSDYCDIFSVQLISEKVDLHWRSKMSDLAFSCTYFFEIVCENPVVFTTLRFCFWNLTETIKFDATHCWFTAKNIKKSQREIGI